MSANTFAFLAHWVESWNWLLRVIPDLHKNPSHHKYWTCLWPVYKSAEILYNIGEKPYDVVDNFTFNKNLSGKTVLLRNFSSHFCMKGRERIQERIYSTVSSIQNDVNVIGLGGLTKDERFTQGGKLIVEKLEGKLDVPIVHGDTLTAATVIRQAKQILNRKRIDTPVMLSGPTSKIGRAVVLELCRNGISVKMLTRSEERYSKIKQEAGKHGKLLTMASGLDEGKDCKLWITGKAVPFGLDLLNVIPHAATVLNFSVPNPIPPALLATRKDIISVEGGLLQYDPSTTNLKFTMRLPPGITYACHAGTMVHAYRGWKHHEVGQVDMDSLTDVRNGAEELGFSLPNLSA